MGASSAGRFEIYLLAPNFPLLPSNPIKFKSVATDDTTAIIPNLKKGVSYDCADL